MKQQLVKLFLLSIPKIGNKTFKNLLSQFGSMDNVFAAISKNELKFEFNKDAINKIIKETDLWLQKSDNNHILFQEDKAYPRLLSEINNSPQVLFLKGNLEILQKPAFAIVGSRKPTIIGEKHTFEFANYLSEYFAIVSGLAFGVDTQAHLGSLKNGTIAVLGSGIENIYPKQNIRLAEKIIESGGLIISEFPIHTSPNKGNFPKRNRIISGLSKGALVTECRLPSGSLITARLAFEQNRSVFAIPGPINNPSYSGNNSVIKNNIALLVTEPNDILKEFNIHSTNNKHTKQKEQNNKILQVLKLQQLSTEELGNILNKDIQILLEELTDLELDGKIANQGGLWEALE